MRFLEVHLASVDLETLHRYYVSVLGLREVESFDTGWLSVQCGDSLLVFDQAPPDSRTRYHLAINIPPDRFESALAWLRERGGPIQDTDGRFRFHLDAWKADSVYFRDPQGNILELIARQDLSLFSSAVTGQPQGAARSQPAADQPFSAIELVAISEIGICADSVPDTAAALQTHLPGLPVYDGEGSDEFTALGDPNGLLIVVRRGRIWNPNSGVAAEPVPLGIVLELENGQRYHLTAPPYPFTVAPIQGDIG